MGAGPPTGLVVHVAITRANGLRYVDVWDSKDDWERFRGETLEPVVGDVLAGYGIPHDHSVVTTEEVDAIDTWVGGNPIPPTTMSTVEAFTRGTDTFNAHDIDGFAAVLADDVVFSAPGGMRGEGKTACVEFYGSWFSAFSDAHLELHDVRFVGETAVEEGTFVGTHDGVLRLPTGDVPATGRAVSVDYIHVLRFRDGKHLSFDLMFDRLSMLEQLGLVPVATLAE